MSSEAPSTTTSIPQREDGPVAGEGAVTRIDATAMTSPQPDPGQGIIAAMATTNLDAHNPPAPDDQLTAGENRVEEGGDNNSSSSSSNNNNHTNSDSVDQNAALETNNAGDSAGLDTGVEQTGDEVQAQASGAGDLQFESNLNQAMLQSQQMLLAHADLLPEFQPGYYDTPEGIAALIAMNGTISSQPYLDPSPDIHGYMGEYGSQQQYVEPDPEAQHAFEENEEPRISAYAKLEFPDGHFYMNTYSLHVGRDQKGYRAAMRREREAARRAVEEAQEPHTPARSARGSHYSVSEPGGILREGNDSDDEERERRRRNRRASKKSSKKSRSIGSSPQHDPERTSLAVPNQPFPYEANYSAGVSVPDMNDPTIDPSSLRPSPHTCPLIGIHPEGIQEAKQYKAISRKHLKIAYNAKKRIFEAEFLGRNGGFVEDVFYPRKEKVPLRSGTRLQLASVVMKFVLPDSAIGETGAEQRSEYADDASFARYSEGGKEMSFEFDGSRQGADGRDTSEDSLEDVGSDEEDERGTSSGDEGSEEGENEIEEDENELEEGDDDQEDLEDLEDLEQQSAPPESGTGLAMAKREKNLEQSPNLQKKRGPGRPPKNGVMSKREEREAKKAAAALQQEDQMATQAGPSQSPVLGKNKVGRPRKHPRPDIPGEPKEKRKYTKRKPKELKEGEVKQEGSGEDQPAKEKKEKKPPRPARSPTPTFNAEDLSPDQLLKPGANYVTLIHEALTNSSTGQMSLPQIYRAIQRKYPFFVLKCTTNGWQSSVRHNLGQHNAFKKIAREGKGWLWGIDEAVSIEKERKKRLTPPPYPTGQNHQPIQANYMPMMPGHPYQMPPGYPPHYHPHPPHFQPGQQPQYLPPNQQMNGNPMPPNHHLHMNGPPPSFAAAIAPQLAASSGPSTYSSPYAPKPAPSTVPPESQQAPTEDRQAPPPRPPPVPEPLQKTPTVPQNKQDEKNEQIPQPHVPDKHSVEVIESFKHSLRERLENVIGSVSVVDALLTSAANRVLGLSSESATGDAREEQIVEHMKGTLATARQSNIESIPGISAPMKPPDLSAVQDPPQQLANHEGTQSTASQQAVNTTATGSGPERPSPLVTRPSFGQGRTNGPSIPRPPMMAPLMKRTNSGSSANAPFLPSAPSSASTAAAPDPISTNGASTPKLAASETMQNEGMQHTSRKRERSEENDPDDMRDIKRMATSGPPQLKA